MGPSALGRASSSGFGGDDEGLDDGRKEAGQHCSLWSVLQMKLACCTA